MNKSLLLLPLVFASIATMNVVAGDMQSKNELVKNESMSFIKINKPEVRLYSDGYNEEVENFKSFIIHLPATKDDIKKVIASGANIKEDDIEYVRDDNKNKDYAKSSAEVAAIYCAASSSILDPRDISKMLPTVAIDGLFLKRAHYSMTRKRMTPAAFGWPFNGDAEKGSNINVIDLTQAEEFQRSSGYIHSGELGDAQTGLIVCRTDYPD